MPQINKNDLVETLSDIWVVLFTESERGWSHETWTEFYDCYVDAAKRVKEVNGDHKMSSDVPDYYLIAGKPTLFCDFYEINLGDCKMH